MEDFSSILPKYKVFDDEKAFSMFCSSSFHEEQTISHTTFQLTEEISYKTSAEESLAVLNASVQDNKGIWNMYMFQFIWFFLVEKYGIQTFPIFGVDKNKVCLCKQGPECKNTGKHPAFFRWRHSKFTDSWVKNKFVEKSSIDDKFLKVLEVTNIPEITNYNTGILCGTKCVKNGKFLVVIDVDKPDAAILEKLFASNTFTVRTGSGGYHFYYFSDTNLGNRIKIQGYGIDSRGEGGFVVGPGSRHKSGNTYDILAGDDIQDLPEFLQEFLKAHDVIKEVVKGDKDTSILSKTKKPRTPINDKLAFLWNVLSPLDIKYFTRHGSIIPAGMRNETLLKLLTYDRRNGFGMSIQSLFNRSCHYNSNIEQGNRWGSKESLTIAKKLFYRSTERYAKSWYNHDPFLYQHSHLQYKFMQIDFDNTSKDMKELKAYEYSKIAHLCNVFDYLVFSSLEFDMPTQSMKDYVSGSVLAKTGKPISLVAKQINELRKKIFPVDIRKHYKDLEDVMISKLLSCYNEKGVITSVHNGITTTRASTFVVVPNLVDLMKKMKKKLDLAVSCYHETRTIIEFKTKTAHIFNERSFIPSAVHKQVITQENACMIFCELILYKHGFSSSKKIIEFMNDLEFISSWNKLLSDNDRVYELKMRVLSTKEQLKYKVKYKQEENIGTHLPTPEQEKLIKRVPVQLAREICKKVKLPVDVFMALRGRTEALLPVMVDRPLERMLGTTLVASGVVLTQDPQTETWSVSKMSTAATNTNTSTNNKIIDVKAKVFMHPRHQEYDNEGGMLYDLAIQEATFGMEDEEVSKQKAQDVVAKMEKEDIIGCEYYLGCVVDVNAATGEFVFQKIIQLSWSDEKKTIYPKKVQETLITKQADELFVEVEANRFEILYRDGVLFDRDLAEKTIKIRVPVKEDEESDEHNHPEEQTNDTTNAATPTTKDTNPSS